MCKAALCHLKIAHAHGKSQSLYKCDQPKLTRISGDGEVRAVEAPQEGADAVMAGLEEQIARAKFTGKGDREMVSTAATESGPVHRSTIMYLLQKGRGAHVWTARVLFTAPCVCRSYVCCANSNG